MVGAPGAVGVGAGGDVVDCAVEREEDGEGRVGGAVVEGELGVGQVEGTFLGGMLGGWMSSGIWMEGWGGRGLRERKEKGRWEGGREGGRADPIGFHPRPTRPAGARVVPDY